MRIFFRILVISSVVFSALGFSLPSKAEELPSYIPFIAEIDNESDLADFEAEGGIVWRRRADMALLLMPESKEKTMMRKRAKGKLQKGRQLHPAMDIARTHFGAEEMHLGNGINSPYTGAGVVVGFCDIGFDPTHPNFVDKDGNCRVKKIVAYDERHAQRTELDHIVPYRQWGTDNSDMFHATHVAGIMAGSCRDTPYWGMAPDAEIVATLSTLYDVGLLMGIEDVIDYAKSVGKPAVVNLSVSDYLGPKDGSTLFNKYIDMLGQEAIICLSAGNNGNASASHRVTFSSAEPDYAFRIHSGDWAQYHVYGATEIWSADERPVALDLFLYDDEEYNTFYTRNIHDGKSEFQTEITPENDDEFAKYFNGAVSFHGEVNPRNNRWCTRIDYDITCDISNISGRWARYNIGLKVKGDEGVHADINCDGFMSRIVCLKGYKAPYSELSITDLAVNDNVICVGMYNNRSSEPLLDGTFREFDFEAPSTAIDSSYGTLLDGTVLPHTVAPGYGMISSFSSKYIDAHPEKITTLSDKISYRGHDYYWGNESGTSMASPYVAGSIACWLEADPSLNIARVHEILSATNRHDFPDAENPRNGRGWFDPYEGLKMVVGSASATPGIADESDIRLIYANGCIDILNPSSASYQFRIFNQDGSEAMPAISSNQNLNSILLDSLKKGVYIAVVKSDRNITNHLKIVK